MATIDLYRGEIFYFTAPPGSGSGACRHFEDGALVVADGRVVEAGPFEATRARYPNTPVTDYSGKLIMPGLIDAHIHFAQSEIIGMYGRQLLDWLNEYTFPAEEAFGSMEYAREIARFFVRELLRNGTTTCAAYATVHAASVSALFSIASEYGMRILAGKVLMDRGAPDYLMDTVATGEAESRALIEEWDGQGRNHYAITPRFAPTSSPEQMAMAQRLKEEYPDTWVHTHLCENKDEIAWVKSLYPDHDGYLDVYHQYGLTGKNCVFAHCVHLEEKEWDRLSETKSSIAFCPTSNLYLGSGLFNLKKAWQKKVKVGMGTDIGAGTTFNMLQTLNEAYKVLQLQGYRLSAYEAFYLATLGGAKSLGLDDLIGNFLPGKEADFVVMEPTATPLQQLRYDNSVSLVDKLFVMMTLGDDRSIYRTYVDGRLVYERN